MVTLFGGIGGGSVVMTQPSKGGEHAAETSPHHKEGCLPQAVVQVYAVGKPGGRGNPQNPARIGSREKIREVRR